MKKVILEEIDRIREIMGFESLISEGIGDEAIGLVGGLIRSDGDAMVNNFVKGLKKSDGSLYLDDAGKQIESWGELTRYADLTKQTVDDLVPGFTDDLIDLFLNGTKEQQKSLRTAAIENYFNSQMRKDFKLWDAMNMSKEDADVFRQDMLAILEDIRNPKLKQAVEDSPFGQKLRGLMPRSGEASATGNLADITKLKKRSNDPKYEYTEEDFLTLRRGYTSGAIDRETYELLVEKRIPKFGEMMKLYDNYKLAAKSGKKDAPISFEEYLISLIKYQVPSKFDRTTVDIIKRITNPFLAAIGLSKTMSIGKGFMWLTGVPTFGYLATLAYHALNIGGGVASKVSGAAGDLDYAVNAGRRWKEFWEKGNNAAMKNLGGGNESIYSDPDTDVNLTYAEGTPDIEVISADENIVKVLGGKISLGGKLYDKVYFRLGFEIAGKDVGRMSPDVIEPIKSSAADTGAGTQQQQQQTTTSGTMTRDQAKAAILAQGYTEPITFTPNSDGQTKYDFTDGDDLEGTATLNNGNIIVQ
jgi:hypothetical protein